MKLSEKIERVAQRIYDLRDEAPYNDTRLWRQLDMHAGKLSDLSTTVAKSESKPKLASR